MERQHLWDLNYFLNFIVVTILKSYTRYFLKQHFPTYNVTNPRAKIFFLHFRPFKRFDLFFVDIPKFNVTSFRWKTKPLFILEPCLLILFIYPILVRTRHFTLPDKIHLLTFLTLSNLEQYRVESTESRKRYTFFKRSNTCIICSIIFSNYS